MLVAPGADCPDIVCKDGIDDERSTVPVVGREATPKGVLPCPFVGSMSSLASMEDWIAQHR